MQPIRNESDLQALVNASKLLATIASWQELGLFEALAGGARRLEDLPCAPRALAVTVPVLLHARLLVGDGERYGLSTAARRLLEAGKLPSSRMLGMLGDLVQLPQVLRTGEALSATSGGVRLDDPEGSRRFLDMLYAMSVESAAQTYEWVSRRLPARDAEVLDLGGGHGRYARTFAQAGHRATLMDFAMVVGFARERHGDAIAYREGDFLAGAALGGPYDAALLSNIVHGQGAEENEALLVRVFEALRPGGQVVLKDMFLDEAQRDPEEAALFGLTMLLYTAKGRSYRFGEVAGWLSRAGFEAPEVAVLDHHALVMARRPAAL